MSNSLHTPSRRSAKFAEDDRRRRRRRTAGRRDERVVATCIRRGVGVLHEHLRIGVRDLDRRAKLATHRAVDDEGAASPSASASSTTPIRDRTVAQAGAANEMELSTSVFATMPVGSAAPPPMSDALSMARERTLAKSRRINCSMSGEDCSTFAAKIRQFRPRASG